MEFSAKVNEVGIYNIHQFGIWTVEIDFNQPEMVQNTIRDMVLAVEAECPVAKFFGVSGIGEGIVFSATYNGNFYQFKAKGEKYSATKVKTIASVDVEKFAKVQEFVKAACSESRLAQGINYLKEMQIPMEMTSIPQYIRWVNLDIIKEESDTIIENQLDPKHIAQAASQISRAYFIAEINSNV